jgi:ABC-type thiamin/hydroxymethylpyrimidine transport system permease subunit
VDQNIYYRCVSLGISVLMQPTPIMKKGFAKTTTVELVTMAILASLGLATKTIIHPVVEMVTTPFYIPAGAVAGGLYMIWPVLAYGIVRKPGAATLTALTQAIISLLLPFGNFGVLSFIIYLGPGVAIDVFFLLSRHKACCTPCCFGASLAANAVGTILVGVLILALPVSPLLFSAVVAAISGGIGGFLANALLVEVRKLGIAGVD